MLRRRANELTVDRADAVAERAVSEAGATHDERSEFLRLRSRAAHWAGTGRSTRRDPNRAAANGLSFQQEGRPRSFDLQEAGEL
jgi:hypothetical protein